MANFPWEELLRRQKQNVPVEVKKINGVNEIVDEIKTTVDTSIIENERSFKKIFRVVDNSNKDIKKLNALLYDDAKLAEAIKSKTDKLLSLQNIFNKQTFNTTDELEDFDKEQQNLQRGIEGLIYVSQKAISGINFVGKSILTTFKKTSAVVWKSITTVLSVAGHIAETVANTLLSSVIFSAKIVDKFLHSLLGQSWESIKSVLGFGLKVTAWVVKIGIKALEYIWEGVKVIFNVGIEVISFAANVAAKGVKVFFSWWFKTLFNIVFNPFNLVFIVPFTIITTAIFSGIASIVLTATGAITTTFRDLINKAFEFFKPIGTWIGNAINSLFDIIQKNYKGSWFESVVNSAYDLIKLGIDKLFGGENIVDTVVNTLSKTWEWLKTEGLSLIDNATKQVTNFLDLVTGQGGSVSLLHRFVNWIGKIQRWIPGFGTTYAYLQSKFGWLFEGRITLVRQNIENIKSALIRQNIANQLIGYKQNNKNSSIEDTDKYLNTVIIPNIKQQIFGNVSEKILDEATRLGKLDSNTTTITPTSTLKSSMTELNSLLDLQTSMLSGKFDANIGDNKRLVDATLSGASNTLANSYKEKSNDLSVIGSQMQELSNYGKTLKGLTVKLTDKEKNLKNGSGPITIMGTPYYFGQEDLMGSDVDVRTKSIITMNTLFFEKIKEKYPKLGYGSVNMLLTHIKDEVNFPYAGNEFKSNELNLFSRIIKNYTPETKTQIINDIGSYIDTVIDKFNIKRSSEEVKYTPFADGGLIIPAKEYPNIVPLDAIGKDFIRSKIKDIKLPEENQNNTLQDVINNITIIEEQTNSVQSYEIYTMERLSKGILGVG